MSSSHSRPQCRLRRVSLVVLAAFVSLGVASRGGAQDKRAPSCRLEVVRTDTLRLADGREAFVAADVADTAMGKTMVAGTLATILPRRDAGLDSAAFVEVARRYPPIFGFVLSDQEYAEPVPLMPGMKRFNSVRLASAGRKGWHVVASEQLDERRRFDDDTVRLWYGRWDGTSWQDIHDFGADSGTGFLSMGRLRLLARDDVVVFAYLRARRQSIDDILVRRRTVSGAWTVDSFRQERATAYVDLAWDPLGRERLTYVQPTAEPGQRDRGSTYQRVLIGGTWSAPRLIMRSATEAVFEPRLIFKGRRAALVWEGDIPVEGGRTLALRTVRSEDGGATFDSAKVTLVRGTYFLEVADVGEHGPLIVTRLLAENLVAIADPFADEPGVLLSRPIWMGYRAMLSPTPSRDQLSLFRADDIASHGAFPHVAVRDVIRRNCRDSRAGAR